MEGTYKTNKRYRDLRDAFLLENEGFRTTVYFDTVGVPTVATGVALLSRKKKAKSDKKPGRRFDRHAENIKACRNALGKNSPLEKSLESFANDALRAIDYTPEPGYSGKKKTVSSFQSTLRGKKLVQLLGPLNRKWESSHSPTISAGDANSISIEVIDQHEEKLWRPRFSWTRK